MDIAEIQAVKQRFGIIGNSPKLNYAIRSAIQVAPTDLSVLVIGESGSGKESFSKIIHTLSARRHGNFIAINCGAIPEGTIDSELFGHEKGAFTGASEARKGYFEVTDGGTIFLDEIGEMPFGTQARLLRVLENQEFIRVGSSKVMKTDVRVIAATNVNLTEAVERGKFREDLFFRLSTVPIQVPPLRERGQDVELLFRKFATDFAERYRTRPIALDEAARDALLQYRFPGNIRQLRNLVEQISVMETDRAVDVQKLRSYLPEKSATSSLPALLPDRSGGKSADGEHFERDLLYKVLFDMRKDVFDTRKDLNELKKLVLSMLQGESNNQLFQDHKDLFQNVGTASEMPAEFSQPSPDSGSLLLGEGRETASLVAPVDEDEEQTYEVQDITDEIEDESLSLERNEKEMIVKALRKNNNKRKYAAKDLGISERTLYRKINYYQIND